MRLRYALQGTLLGLGAPVGLLMGMVAAHYPAPFSSTLAREWHYAGVYYIYMTVGTIVAFTVFGYVLGRRNEALKKLSDTDGLTGVFNHRYLHERLGQEIKRADRYHAPVTCLMLDIDDFKKINDHYGHPFGDTVLATVVRLIREAVREIDVVGRYGGEEFLVIMPQTRAEAAIPLAERILNTVRTHSFSIPIGGAAVTLSIGLATYPSPELNVTAKDSLLSAADQALYQAKRSGKNRAVVWQL